MKQTYLYDRAYFRDQMDASYASAKAVVPHVLGLTEAQSVVDFGCGVGTWLRACLESGVDDVMGVDGHDLGDNLLAIPREHLACMDLTQPISLGRRFDLVLSLEVAEHLPVDAAHTFIDTLTKHGPVVLFSAAVPGQGGSNHLNERWPDYWCSAFSARGYACLDCLRDVFWDDGRVEWWYRQNMFLFASTASLSQSAKIVGEIVHSPKLPRALVHPEMALNLNSPGVRKVIQELAPSLKRAFTRRLTRQSLR